MAKKKRYFMYLHWSHARGQTEETAPYACGTGSYLVHTPLKDIDATRVYTSESRAERQAAKYNTLYWRTKVIEVTDLVKGGNPA